MAGGGLSDTDGIGFWFSVITNVFYQLIVKAIENIPSFVTISSRYSLGLDTSGCLLNGAVLVVLPGTTNSCKRKITIILNIQQSSHSFMNYYLVIFIPPLIFLTMSRRYSSFSINSSTTCK